LQLGRRGQVSFRPHGWGQVSFRPHRDLTPALRPNRDLTPILRWTAPAAARLQIGRRTRSADRSSPPASGSSLQGSWRPGGAGTTGARTRPVRDDRPADL